MSESLPLSNFDMRDNQLLRYSRQIALPELEIEGQQKINSAKVLIIGLGALGTVAANYLCRSGVGNMGVCDFDKVHISNLHRQVLYNTSDIGKSKVEQSLKELSIINPECNLIGIDEKIDLKQLQKLISDYDLVIDATDNFKTRYAINKICFIKKTFMVSGSALGWIGQIILFDFLKLKNPCYECCFGYNKEEDLSCSETGIIAPVAGVIGALQALEAIKKITHLDVDEDCTLKEFNLLTGRIRRIKVKKNPRCRICGEG